MLRTTLIGLLALSSWMIASAASAQVVYKCATAKGITSYQETPCKRGELIKRIVPDPPPKALPKPAEPAPKPADPASPAATPQSPPPPASPTAAPRPSIAYRCTRYDGTSYYSASLNPKRHNVPLYALDQPPPLPPGGTLSPEARIWVVDECVEVPNMEACGHYREQLAFVNAQIRRGTGEANKLERERKRLTAIRGSRCPN